MHVRRRAEVYDNTEGWKFAVNDLDAKNAAALVGSMSAASGLNDPQTLPVLRMQILAPLSVDVDLRTARLRVTRLLREVLGAEELVKGPKGEDFGVALLLPAATTGAALGRFETAVDRTPRISAVVQVKPRRALGVDLSVDRAAIVDPQVCIGAPEQTRLNFSIGALGRRPRAAVDLRPSRRLGVRAGWTGCDTYAARRRKAGERPRVLSLTNQRPPYLGTRSGSAAYVTPYPRAAPNSWRPRFGKLMRAIRKYDWC